MCVTLAYMEICYYEVFKYNIFVSDITEWYDFSGFDFRSMTISLVHSSKMAISRNSVALYLIIQQVVMIHHIVTSIIY